MTSAKIDLALVLPPDIDTCDRCIQRLTDALEKRPGIERAHVDRAGATPMLCVHYDKTTVAVADLERLAHAAGVEITTKFHHISLTLSNLRHRRQARTLEALLAREPGVVHAAVALGARRLFVELDPAVTTRRRVLDLVAGADVATPEENRRLTRRRHARHGDDLPGGAPRPAPAAGTAAKESHRDDDGHDHASGASKEHGADDGHGRQHAGGQRVELISCLACGALTAVGWGLGRLSVPEWAATAVLVAAYATGSWLTLREVWVALRARKLEIDLLMLLAAGGAAVLGEWLEGALLLFLFSLGHTLEGYAMGRARRAIEALAELVPETALRVRADGTTEEVPVDALRVGDHILVKPNTRIAADGFVVAGTSAVNQAPITGESVPVDKRPVSDAAAARARPESVDAEGRGFAGTINGASALTIEVTRTSANSTLARVAEMVAAAETQRSATQQLTERFERIFVPVILAFVVLLLFAWVVVDEPFTASLYRAMAVLVAASPCALAIATPSAVLSGVARAARGGVLIKGGAHLESLGQVRVVAFDKTGTLTEGRPKLTDVRTAEGASEDELLRMAYALEKQSDHPLAQAVVTGVVERSPSAASSAAQNVEAIIGFGVQGEVGGTRVVIGKPGLFTKDGPIPAGLAADVEALEQAGRTLMIVRAGDRFLGVMGLMDTPRESAKNVVEALHRIGVQRTIMLTGDNARVGAAVANAVGIREVRADLLPDDKVTAITEIARGNDRVAMIGDGVNDAPALAAATVGIAMGAGGSDVALETADVALMADDLRALPFAIGLSRAARRIILQNLWASLGMVAFLVPATLFGFAGIGVAVALHEGSTLIVVANALRLLAYRDR